MPIFLVIVIDIVNYPTLDSRVAYKMLIDHRSQQPVFFPLPIHLFKYFCCRLYHLGTITDRRTDR